MSSVVEEVLAFRDAGARILFAHGHSGQLKIKVQFGFLHLKTKRYVVDGTTMAEIKERMRVDRSIDARAAG